MGVRNYLIEGVSGSGKTAVADELQRRGHHVIHGDRTLACVGDPQTGEPLASAPTGEAALPEWRHEHWIWPPDKVRSLIADHSEAISFFCGGSRNFPQFIDLFDGVFVLDVDADTLNERLDRRPDGEFGKEPAERQLVVRLHATGNDTPQGVVIDATAPPSVVANEIVLLSSAEGTA